MELDNKQYKKDLTEANSEKGIYYDLKFEWL